MSEGNVRCKRNCGNSIRKDLAEENNNWVQHEDGGMLCPSCNPDGPDW